MEDNKGTNLGCFIIGVLITIGSIVYTMMTTSSEEFVQTGCAFLVVVGIVLAYYLIKKISNKSASSSLKDSYNDSKFSWKGWLAVIGVIVLIGGIVVLLANSYDVAFIIGVIVTICFILGLAILIYINN